VELALKVLVVIAIGIAAAIECAKSKPSATGEWKVLRVCYTFRLTMMLLAVWMTWFFSTHTTGGNRLAVLMALAVPTWLIVLVLHIHAVRFSESGMSVRSINTIGKWRHIAWTNVREIDIDTPYLVFHIQDGTKYSVSRFTFRGTQALAAFVLDMTEKRRCGE
jgi:thiol:disulfide interchange protein